MLYGIDDLRKGYLLVADKMVPLFPQILKISKALIAANIDDDEIDEELERFREKRLKDVAKEEQDANALLVSQLVFSHLAEM